MSNTIDWGKGAQNNTIDWGQGVVTNSIYWGMYYDTSWSGETNIIGSIVPSLVVEFVTRVQNDEGVVEATLCLQSTLNTFEI